MRLIVLLLALPLAGLPASGAAQEASTVPVGARVRIVAPDLHRGWIVGRVVSADSATLVLDPSRVRRWGSPLVLAPVAVTRLQVSRGREGTLRKQGALVGALVGLAFGAYAGWALDYEEGTYDGYLIYPPLSGAAGAGVGVLVGSFLPKEGWSPVPLPVRTVLRREGGPRVAVALSIDT
jgi:hypothetical protein